MSDLRGFTALSESRDPEDMVRLLNRYLERMSEILVKFDGIIDEILGDAILAVFGIPEIHDDDPLRAVACAVAMQNALVGLNDDFVGEGYPPLEMGIGINTGSVIVGNIGSEIRAKYGIVGATVNAAARIESNAVGGQVLAGEPTYTLVKGSVRADPAFTVMMKGLRRPLVIYPVTAVGPPYNIELTPPAIKGDGIEIALPFHCQRIEGKKVAGPPIRGETVCLGEDEITVSAETGLEPLTDVKLNFDFCTDVHCFGDIYAKVTAVEKHGGRGGIRLRITSICEKDREILEAWIAEGS